MYVGIYFTNCYFLNLHMIQTLIANFTFEGTLFVFACFFFQWKCVFEKKEVL